MENKLEKLCSMAEVDYLTNDVDDIIYCKRLLFNQLRKGWDARVRDIMHRCNELYDAQELIDEASRSGTDTHFSYEFEKALPAMIHRVLRRALQAQTLTNPWNKT